MDIQRHITTRITAIAAIFCLTLPAIAMNWNDGRQHEQPSNQYYFHPLQMNCYIYPHQDPQQMVAKRARRIDLELFGKKTGIEKWRYPSLSENKETSSFKKNLLLSTLVFAYKKRKKPEKLIRRFAKNPSKIGKLKFIQRLHSNITVTSDTSDNTYRLPVKISTGVLSKLSISGGWLLTPLDENGKTLLPKNLLKLMLYNIYNYNYQNTPINNENIFVYMSSSDKNLIYPLEHLGFKKNFHTSLKRAYFMLNMEKFLEICEDPELSLLEFK